MKKILLKMIVVVSITLIGVIGSSLYFSENIIHEIEENMFKNKINEVQAVQSETESYFNDIVNILVLTSKDDAVKSVDYAGLLSEELKGIPHDADPLKRNLAKEILKNSLGIETISFILPNGDMYLTEPYNNQQSVTQLNWAHRDWYQGTISTLKPYISEVYNATATRTYAVSVNVPVFSDGGEFVGIWRAVLDLKELYNTINYVDSEYLVFFDHKGTELPISLGIFEDIPKNVIEFESANLALAGEIGIMKESPNGKQILVVYSPLTISPHTWGALLIEPVDLAYASINKIRLELYTLTFFISVAIVCTSFFYYRNVKSKLEIAEKLTKIDKLKGEFSSMMAHELKTPLVPILGNTDFLKNPKMIDKLEPIQLEAINSIEKNAIRLEILISDLLDVQKIHLNRMKFNKSTFDVREFMETVRTNLNHYMKEKQITFVNNTTNSFELVSDENRLRQVFGNLVKNAVDFVPDGGRIEIGATISDNSAQFFVKDNGIGIPQEKQHHLFKKFYQIDTSIKRKHGGTGLGLAICKGIVEGLNGKIWFESKEGQGTTFYFSIPLEEQKVKVKSS